MPRKSNSKNQANFNKRFQKDLLLLSLCHHKRQSNPNKRVVYLDLDLEERKTKLDLGHHHLNLQNLCQGRFLDLAPPSSAQPLI